MYFYFYYQNWLQPKLARRVCVCLAQSFEPTCALQITSDGWDAKLRNSFLANNSWYKHNGVERKVKKYQWNVFVWRFPLCNKILWAVRLPRSFLIIYGSTFVTLRCLIWNRAEVILPFLYVSLMRRKQNIKCMCMISGQVLASWYVCQKNYQLTRFLATCTFALSEQSIRNITFHSEYRQKEKSILAPHPNPSPYPISHPEARGQCFTGWTRPRASLSTNWVKFVRIEFLPLLLTTNPPNRERMYKEWGNRIRGGGEENEGKWITVFCETLLDLPNVEIQVWQK